MASTRPLVSYDDITLPYQASPPQSHNRPPAKKRKGNKHSRGRNAVVSAEDSRELSHDEIWDDSALIDAWDAATEEYEAYNGPDKGWKKEPIHKSPLWYNTPKTSDENKSVNLLEKPSVLSTLEDHENSQPLDFDTFTPSHNPALDIPGLQHHLPDPLGPMVSQDEAFTRALGAMYWSGYWTAMYHALRQTATSDSVPEDGVQQSEEFDESQDEVEADLEDENEEQEDTFISTQR
ncbi:hypothetical protein H0H93_016856 [Arthromyces matolae]|nr:hypothetical protein H0H93_016856 [Arthromyces matolae]